ncbi:MAG: hypothetical protein Homavirus17_8, partial [Homavirus sp.]
HLNDAARVDHQEDVIPRKHVAENVFVNADFM